MTATRAAGLAAFLTAAAAVAADPPAASGPAAPAGPDAVVRDHAGAEVKVTGVRLPAGVRRLGWLPDSPLAVEFRETNSTTYAAGVLTRPSPEDPLSLPPPPQPATIAASAQLAANPPTRIVPHSTLPCSVIVSRG